VVVGREKTRKRRKSLRERFYTEIAENTEGTEKSRK
jgi:hypothetical protein